jgi:hypothetical protein
MAVSEAIAGQPTSPASVQQGTGIAGAQATPDARAMALALAITVTSLVVAIAWGTWVPTSPVRVSLPVDQGFTYFAAFYVAAQVIERLMEPVTWLLDQFNVTDNANKPNRTAVIYSLTLLAAVVLSSGFNLHFLSAVGVKDLPNWLDAYATALVISGGTKPLHDFISYLQQSKDQATKQPATGGQSNLG